MGFEARAFVVCSGCGCEGCVIGEEEVEVPPEERKVSVPWGAAVLVVVAVVEEVEEGGEMG